LVSVTLLLRRCERSQGLPYMVNFDLQTHELRRLRFEFDTVIMIIVIIVAINTSS